MGQHTKKIGIPFDGHLVKLDIGASLQAFSMKFVIEPEGPKLHWVVKCMEKGKPVEIHRFYQNLENFLYHRGKHGDHELAAMKELEDYLEAHPSERHEVPPVPRNYSVKVTPSK